MVARSMKGGLCKRTLSLCLAGATLALGVMGSAAPAAAYINFTGVWRQTFYEDFPDRLPGPEIGDYAGLPINDAARHRAKAWNASLLTIPEYQCRVHPSDYSVQFSDMRIWEVRDAESQELIAIRMHKQWASTERYIWMDGRARPPDYAAHTSMGFSKGEFRGHKLVVTTTHLKEGYIRRNGVARSDKASVTEHFIRHGDHLAWSVFIQDPVYLAEPFFRNRDYVYETGVQIGPYPCETVEEVVRPEGEIPHYLPGQNPALEEFAQRRRVPVQAAMGGPATMYPDYMERMRAMALPPVFEESVGE